MTDPAIETEGLTHRFGGRTAIRDVNLCVPTGSVHAFVGPNGAGKTTTLNILATLLSPTRGRVRILGVDTKREPKRVRRKVGYMPEHFAMYRQLSVFEYLDFFAAAHGQRMDHRNLVLADVVERFSLHELRSRRIGALSRGQQQRVCLARVMLHDPKVLLLDEPASGLDPRARSRLLRLVRELAREGRTVLMSSHILGELADVCDDVTILDRGRVRFSGTMRRLLARGDGSRLRYTIEVDGAAAELCGGLQLVDGVLDATVDPEAATRLVVDLDAEVTTIRPVLAWLLALEVSVRAVREDRRGLDEAFLELTSPGGET